MSFEPRFTVSHAIVSETVFAVALPHLGNSGAFGPTS